ncbi:Ankyrin repeat-containing protein [Glarea lozoyensis ATCC 20868]|uniref:Ankyrin repeat-containing protein n=1 Tax=Glarea lozoyensis (strain ATCC 20868 / MF5171) TaxID=1116229 RepID=S3CWK8_GLAL2|nr:Ankyrin repeat-containing protein [Glarea lozoyensis ATCC 20868]EPE29309.1 Ankyrin repeat-containing protein [Glarea lozoyensis ATCC 20868]
MRLIKGLKNKILGALKGKAHEESTAPKIAWVPAKHFKALKFEPSGFELPFICEDKVFPLLDLPLELVKVIISEVVTIQGSHRSVKLRIVNKLFDQLIVETVFSTKNASLLPNDSNPSYIPMQQTGRIAFAKILEQKLMQESARQSPLRRTIDGCINLLETLGPDSPENVDQRRIHYSSILCARAVNILSMGDAIRCLRAEDKTEIEEPRIGALILAAATGNNPVVQALVAQETVTNEDSATDDSSVTDRSWSWVRTGSVFFGCAMSAAAEYGHMGVVEIFLNFPLPSIYACIGAIRGGNKGMLEKLLDHYQDDPDSEDPMDDRQIMIACAAAVDQTSILDTLIKHISKSMSISRKQKALTHALYKAVCCSARSTTRFLLKSGVNINHNDDWSGNGIYLASKRGDLQTVKLLVEYGWEVQSGAYQYEEGMHVAAAKGHVDVVEFFLELGVDPNCRFPSVTPPSDSLDEEFWHPVDPRDPATINATRNGDFRMFCFLVMKGCRVDLENEFVSTPKQWLKRVEAWKENNFSV